jgi:ElaB/YqjD/DUF883 family membrane-anchored ribosome-binding protein
MSDFGRKDFTDKVSEKVTPDSQKSTFEKAKEDVTGALDKGASSITPDSQKSFGQSVADHAQSGHDDAKSDVKQNQETLSETAASYVEAAKDQVLNAAEYVSNAVSGGNAGSEATTGTTTGSNTVPSSTR